MPRKEENLIAKFGAVDLRVSEHDAEAGVLRVAENVYPDGRNGYRVVHGAAQVPHSANVVASFTHVRRKHGFLTNAAGTSPEGNNAPLERLVFITDDMVQVADADTGSKRNIGALPFTSTIRKVQSCQIGDTRWFASSDPAGFEDGHYHTTGKPESVYSLQDDKLVPFDFPPLPTVTMTLHASTGVHGLPKGVYAYRYAWKLKDGTESPMSIPFLFLADNEEVEFILDPNYPLGSIDPIWDELISGIQIYLTEGNFDFTTVSTNNLRAWADALCNNPYYKITEIHLTKPICSVSDRVRWADRKRETFEVVNIAPGIDEALPQSYGESGSQSNASRLSSIVYYPQADDDLLNTHGIRASACYSQNKRLVLGDVAYDFVLPDAHNNFDGHEGYNTVSAAVYVRLGVTIRRESETYTRISDPIGYNGAIGTNNYQYDALNLGTVTTMFLRYPDIHVEDFRVYISNSLGGPYTLAKTALGNAIYPAKNSKGLNLSYALGAPILEGDFSGDAMPDLNVNERYHWNPNGVMVSDIWHARTMHAKRFREIGNSKDDQVMAFATHGQPMSAGQAGQFPLMVFTRNGVYTLSVGRDDIAYLGDQPISTRRGVVSRYGVVEYDGNVFMASKDGIYLVRSSSMERISTAVEGVESTVLHKLHPHTALGILTNGESARQELWVADGITPDSPIHVFSLENSQWFTIIRRRKHFHEWEGVLYGVGHDGKVYREANDAAAELDFRIETAAFMIGDAGVTKQLTQFSLRQRFKRAMKALMWTLYDYNPDNKHVVLASQSVDMCVGADTWHLQGAQAYMIQLNVSGVGTSEQLIEGFEMRYVPKYAHRRRDWSRCEDVGAINDIPLEDKFDIILSLSQDC